MVIFQKQVLPQAIAAAFTQNTLDLLQKMLIFDPEDRITTGNAMMHQYFKVFIFPSFHPHIYLRIHQDDPKPTADVFATPEGKRYQIPYPKRDTRDDDEKTSSSKQQGTQLQPAVPPTVPAHMHPPTMEPPPPKKTRPHQPSLGK
jgi:serine/threonine protein kinase